MTVIAEEKPVVVEGFLLNVHVPTEERLSVVFDCSEMSWTKYRDMIIKLQDLMAEIDDAYKKREGRGRSLGARYRRIAHGDKVSRRRVLKFIPYPNRFANILRNVRREVYGQISSTCMVLQRMQFGAYRHNIYLLPYPRAPGFMAYIEEQNKTIESLNREIEEFRESLYCLKIKELLEDAGLNSDNMNGEPMLPRITVDLTPLRLDASIIEEFVEARYRQVFSKISEEERRGLEALQRELEKKRRELVINAVENLRGQISRIVKRMLAKRKLKGVKEELERLKALASDVGLEAVASTVIEPLIETVEDPEKAEVEFGRDVLAGVDGRITALINSL